MFWQNTAKFRAKNSEKFEKQVTNVPATNREETSEVRLRQVIENDAIDAKYGFERVRDHLERTGFLLNMHSNEILDEDKRLISSVDFYFMEEDGTRFKVSYPFMPYFYILTRRELIHEVSEFLSKKYSGVIGKIEVVNKDDLDMLNHLIGLKQKYIKLSFFNQTDAIKVRKQIVTAVNKNKERQSSNSYYSEMLKSNLTNNINLDAFIEENSNQMENILDIREYDVPFHVRVSIDLKIFCGSWYTVKCPGANISDPPTLTPRPDLIDRPEPIVLAFDIETTKLPLKFPDANTDQIMMISYMIDGQGYLITNREILSKDIEDFEYTPKPEYEGKFTIFNEPNELALLQKFFDHIIDIRPHIFVTYNGDFFDWPFIETRAAVYDLDMNQEIGFSKNNEGIYCCRPAIHMDCLCWVKRDSYLPVGSQSLKAVAKAKLRYDPVELDPEEMCPLAVSQPQVLSNYSVSDAVATYYLYMQYVHPFIFALATIIPCKPEEVLRKGSGTLCENLLMVEAFHCNIIFPNKQQTVLNKLTDDGHVLIQETYVGGHVEALECGVFRADIPCRFRMDAGAIDKLIEQVPKTLAHAIEIEEGVPLELVNNLEEVTNEIIDKLILLKEQPMRLERPLIYHLDVGAMYPNIILTNRLQPCATVNETICAACDFNKPDASCQRNMAWMSRSEYMPATRNEYYRIQQQLETEKFPSKYPNGPLRAFHQLTREEQADLEKKRLSVYCRKVYKCLKVTRMDEKTTTICQRENSFYVDAVRAFRDRRYEYKLMSKKAKHAVMLAIKAGDASEIKSAKNREILYDSLQLAHKCILNSFYGYVMRRGARWYSMEMGGIVCHTGANIIMKAREIIEQVGRPLELDTDGIWCILPASFPENFTLFTDHEKGKLNISYPNAILNAMVKEHFTNDQYNELINSETFEYRQKCENSIFFEVDGPYKAMVLPASKEEGKKLKKRYAVFNFDDTLAELKGFEIKRRGELQLIKNFQSSVFEAFLKGDSLETCYGAVAQVADYWLDVLFSHGRNIPDSELFDLISENRSMSKKLAEYGAQKSTSISTAKRLAEFLGDQMVKDAGLACKYVISKKPDSAPVTERAIPLAIFQADEEVQKHYLRKWLRDSSLTHIDIRDIVDWDYYIERLGGSIQKIITIPAAMQGIPNPVSRVRHPDWLHKRILEKDDHFKQRRINDMFKAGPKPTAITDIEDFAKPSKSNKSIHQPSVTKRKRNTNKENEFDDDELNKTWREVLGAPPPPYKQLNSWILFQKRKWRFQHLQRNHGRLCSKRTKRNVTTGLRSATSGTVQGFIQKAQRAILVMPWQILQVFPTAIAGEFKLWILIQNELHLLKLTIPRVFYVNLRTPKLHEEGDFFKKCNRTLPRSKKVHYLYRYSVSEDVYQKYGREMFLDQSDPDIEGIYETQVPLIFRAFTEIGCVAKVLPGVSKVDHFHLNDLNMTTVLRQDYLSKDAIRQIYFYNHKHPTKPQQMFGLFLTPMKKALVIVVDTVRTNLMPNLDKLYQAERIVKKENTPNELLPPECITFDVRIETDLKQVYKLIQRTLQSYKDEKKGPTLIACQTLIDINVLQSNIPILTEFPQAQIHIQDIEELYNVIEWQKIGSRALIRHYLNSERVLDVMKEQSRYFHLPLGNISADPALFGSDLFYARHLAKHNHILWCSFSNRPDLGGSEENDARLLAENLEGSSEVCNKFGWYSTVCVELDIDSLAINTMLQSHHICDIEGTNAATNFDAPSITSLESLLGKSSAQIYDESSRCAEAFKILRTMVTTWMKDISIYRNRYADFQMIHFYRWLRSTKALLYDPAILRSLQNLMKKLFLQLVAEFKRLGVAIIYANFNKIVVCTKKRTIEDALANVEFVVAAIRNKELFHSLEITYRQCWKQLVWYDYANFAAIQGKLPDHLQNESNQPRELENDQNNEDADDGDDDDDDDDNAIVMNWNLIEKLPEVCQNSFNGIIAAYISAINSRLKSNQNNTRIVTGLSQTQSSFGLEANDGVAEFAREIISSELSQKLFEITEKIQNRFKSQQIALEFIKAVCHVLSLERAIKPTVDQLKGNLLRLIGVGEFSDIAKWNDTTVTYVIPQIICKACNHCRDIDLGRDQHRSDSAWCCPLCNTSYDNDEIEDTLLDIISRKMLAYNLQDLQCNKCGQIKMENLIRHCECAGEFSCLISKTSVVNLLETFQSLSETFNMATLKQTTSHILKLIY